MVPVDIHNLMIHSQAMKLWACQVTPSWQPWRCQRVTPDIPHMWGMCSHHRVY